MTCPTRIAQITGEGVVGFRVETQDDRAALVLEVLEDRAGVSWSLSIGCVARPWRLPLPVCAVELQLSNLDLGPEARYTAAMSTPADFLPSGRVADLSECGVTFHPLGVCAMCLPVVCVHDQADATGVRWEVLCGDRPHLHVLPMAEGRVRTDLAWPLSRHLQPGQWHRFAGPLRLTGFGQGAAQAIRDWRDHAAERYGMTPPPTAAWIKRALIAEINLNPDNGGHTFRRLDDPRARDLLRSCADMGYSLIYAVSQFNVGPGGWLSPVDYQVREDLGGVTAERQFLDWAHELGLRVLIWVTTVGVDRFASQVAEHPYRFTRRRDGHHYYAWGDPSGPAMAAYAPDADPESASWRRWLDDQVRSVVARGYDAAACAGDRDRSRSGFASPSAAVGRFHRQFRIA